MKTCTKCKASKGIGEFYAGAYECKACAILRSKAWYEKNRERLGFKKRKPAFTKEQIRAIDRERSRVRWGNPAERAKAVRRVADWFRRHPEFVARRNVQRRVRGNKRCPKWANDFFITHAYLLARQRTALTNLRWHVDHIVPLNHPLVSGLHVEYNLQVVPAHINESKSNSYWPDMPS